MSTTDDMVKGVLNAELRRQKAFVTVDLAELDLLLADDLRHVHSVGRVDDKEQFIAHLQRMGGFIGIERGKLDVKVDGNIAVVMGPTTNRVRSPEDGTEKTLEGFLAQILRRTPKGWQFFLYQLTPYRKP